MSGRKRKPPRSGSRRSTEAEGGGQGTGAGGRAPRAQQQLLGPVWREGAATCQETDGGRAAGHAARGNDKDEDSETGQAVRAPSGPCLSPDGRRRPRRGRGPGGRFAALHRCRVWRSGAPLRRRHVWRSGCPALGTSARAVFQRRLLTLSLSHFGNSHDVSDSFIILVFVLVACAQRSLTLRE